MSPPKPWCFPCSAKFSGQNFFHPIFSLVLPPFLEPTPFMILFSKFPPLYKRLSPSVCWAYFSTYRCSSVCYTCHRVKEHLFILTFIVFFLVLFSLPYPGYRRKNTKTNMQQLCWQNIYIQPFSSFCTSLINVEFSSKMFNSGVNFEHVCNILSSLKKKEKRKIPRCEILC